MKTLPLLALLVLLAGCAKLDPSGPYHGDRVLYNADNAIVTANAVFVSFMKWEYDNRETLAKWPEIRKTADRVRANNRDWLETAIKARNNYKVIRNTTTENALTDAVKVLTDTIIDAQKYLKP
jgi:hypothetical protein